MFKTLLTEFVDLIIPPRPSERVVRALTVSQLQELMHEDGLPYHEPRVTALIWELKYYRHPRAAALGAALLAEQLLAVAAEEVGRPLLVPVPMHPARRKERGHNQTEVLLAATLRRLGADAAGFEYRPEVLVRTADTPTQQGLERATRLTNVAHSMAATRIDGRACIVVDDVATTGATLAEAQRALRLAGARVVHTLVLARS